MPTGFHGVLRRRARQRGVHAFGKQFLIGEKGDRLLAVLKIVPELSRCPCARKSARHSDDGDALDLVEAEGDQGLLVLGGAQHALHGAVLLISAQDDLGGYLADCPCRRSREYRVEDGDCRLTCKDQKGPATRVRVLDPPDLAACYQGSDLIAEIAPTSDHASRSGAGQVR